MRSVITLVLGILLAAAGSGLRAQTQPAAKPASGGAAKAAPQAPKSTAKTTTSPATKTAMKKPAKAASAATGDTGPAEGPGDKQSGRRDPFESLVARQQAQKNAAAVLPPGKAGLQVSTLRLDGIVRAPNGMIAVVTNPQARTYFLREGDQLYDGRVEKIAMDGVSFHELGKDAFGKPVERQVNKRIYSSAGEQQ
jgi:Tfp pilus assembly protein PilP